RMSPKSRVQNPKSKTLNHDFGLGTVDFGLTTQPGQSDRDETDSDAIEDQFEKSQDHSRHRMASASVCRMGARVTPAENPQGDGDGSQEKPHDGDDPVKTIAVGSQSSRIVRRTDHGGGLLTICHFILSVRILTNEQCTITKYSGNAGSHPL